MGGVFSQGNIFVGPGLSEEVEASFNQILHAFNHELELQPRHRTDRGSSKPPIAGSAALYRHDNNRSRSLEPTYADEHRRSVQPKLSVIRRQWQCQFCHTNNETDAQICADCGSNKINVYIPVIDHMDHSPRKQLAVSSSTPTR